MLFLVSTLAFSPPDQDWAVAEWKNFKKVYSKSYTSPEQEKAKYKVYLQSRKEVAEINARANGTWTAALNEFSDETWEEFAANRLMAPQNCSATHKGSGWKAATNKQIPPAIDWRSKIPGWTVKSQGHCGSCWTFSTAGSMEAHHYLKYGVLKNLSEQQLVDCADAFNNHGCNGGLPSQAFEYLKYTGGQDTEFQYPYTAVTGKTCKYDGKPAAKVAEVVNITTLDERELLKAVGTEGPVSIAFQVAKDFRFYSKGVYNGTCDTAPSSVNHAVVAVGYGTAKHPFQKEKEVPYWTVRNSWGASFGMDGYFEIIRGYNKCGLSDCASFPRPA
jgi:cathepsin H